MCARERFARAEPLCLESVIGEEREFQISWMQEQLPPSINWLSADFPDSVDRQLIIFEKQAPGGIYGIGEKAPVMMCDRAAVKMIAGFSKWKVFL